MLTRYANATVADLDPMLGAWDWGGGRGLLLHGPAGTGKTHAAVALRRDWIDRHPTTDLSAGVPFVSVARLLQEKRRQMDGPTEWVEPNWRTARMVVFDDWDKVRMTDWAREELFTIVDTLYCRCVPVVVTSNLQPRDFARHSGEFITDRIKQMCVPVLMDGPSRRRTPHAVGAGSQAGHAEGGNGQSPTAARPDARAGVEPEQQGEPDGAQSGERPAQAGLGRAGGAAPAAGDVEARCPVPAGNAAGGVA